MKYVTVTIFTLLFLLTDNALASGFICTKITGSISPLAPDKDCTIKKLAKSDYYPDATFLLYSDTNPTCFYTTLALDAPLDSITGKAYSGLIANGIGIDSNGVNLMTAVSAIRLTGTFDLGWFFTKDVIYDPFDSNTKELMTIVGGGTKNLRGGIEITGNTLIGQTSFTGNLCIENK